MNIRIDRNVLERITDPTQERNIYVHPNSIARDIFWQRLETIFSYLEKHTRKDYRVLDLGGGSGVFAKALSSFFESVDIVDLDVDCAENVKKYFGLANVNIYKQDISEYKRDFRYDVIIAADVLEHFMDLSFPVGFIKDNLKLHGGLLFVSLPTENWIYELGRKIVRKTKPVDHYHPSEEVITFLEAQDLKRIDGSFVPKYIVSIPLFEVGVFRTC